MQTIAYYDLDVFSNNGRISIPLVRTPIKCCFMTLHLAEGLFAKRLHYGNQKDYDSATPYLEKVGNPCSAEDGMRVLDNFVER